jgi:hypothetical protein
MDMGLGLTDADADRRPLRWPLGGRSPMWVFLLFPQNGIFQKSISTVIGQKFKDSVTSFASAYSRYDSEMYSFVGICKIPKSYS